MCGAFLVCFLQVWLVVNRALPYADIMTLMGKTNPNQIETVYVGIKSENLFGFNSYMSQFNLVETWLGACF